MMMFQRWDGKIIGNKCGGVRGDEIHRTEQTEGGLELGERDISRSVLVDCCHDLLYGAFCLKATAVTRERESER